MVIIGVDAESRIDAEVLKEIRSQAPLIVLDETYNGALETFDAGADQILPKPFVPDALIGATKVELRGRVPVQLSRSRRGSSLVGWYSMRNGV